MSSNNVNDSGSNQPEILAFPSPPDSVSPLRPPRKLPSISLESIIERKSSFQSDSIQQINSIVSLPQSTTNVITRRPMTSKIGPLRIFPQRDSNVIEVSWSNLSYTVKRRSFFKFGKTGEDNVKHILKSLNGRFKSGQMTAIMGPSGAGKSTLLDCIRGQKKVGVSGRIVISTDYIKIGFVEQQDNLLTHLTVRESLIFASKLRSKNYGADHQDVAQSLIEKLGLENCADTYAIRCSGGQQKRLCIALELVAKANILILDEPTTGLDSSACSQTITALHSLTRQRVPMAVVATIHQPSASIFNKFDHLYILSKNGRCVYQGSPSEMIQTLTKVGLTCPNFYNPADFIIEVAAGDFGEQNITLLAHYAKEPFKEEPQGNELLQVIQNTKQGISQPLFRHIFLLAWRSILATNREPKLNLMRILTVVPTAFIVGLLFDQDTGAASGCPPSRTMLYAYDINAMIEKFEFERTRLFENLSLIFVMPLLTIFNSLTPVLLEFPKEMFVFKKEYHNNYYGVFSYFMAKTIADLPFQLMPSVAFILIIWFMTGQVMDHIWRLYSIIGTSIIIASVGQSHGMLFGALFMENANAASFAGGISLLPIIIFGGFFKKLSSLPGYLLVFSYISYFHYVFNSFLVIIYGTNRCDYEHKIAEEFINTTNLQRPQWLESMSLIFEQQGISDGEPEDNLMLVFGGKSTGNGTSLVLAQFEIEDSKNEIWFNIEMLLVTMIVLKIFTYFALKFKCKE